MCDAPDGTESRGAGRFYGHVAKRIYATLCSYSRIASFSELRELVERELRPYYLDGPNSVDWIFPNSVAAEREQRLYVDYVRDITDETGDHHWTVPPASLFDPPRYQTPDCVTLCQALSEAGARCADGLAVIARIWRGFKPAPDTGCEKLRRLIRGTLKCLAEAGLNELDEVSTNFVVVSWPFPLWSFAMKEPRGKTQDLKELREERARIVEWIKETEANRDPPPAICRSKVEALSVAYCGVDGRMPLRGGLRNGFAGKIVRYELPS